MCANSAPNSFFFFFWVKSKLHIFFSSSCPQFLVSLWLLPQKLMFFYIKPQTNSLSLVLALSRSNFFFSSLITRFWTYMSEFRNRKPTGEHKRIIMEEDRERGRKNGAGRRGKETKHTFLFFFWSTPHTHPPYTSKTQKKLCATHTHTHCSPQKKKKTKGRGTSVCLPKRMVKENNKKREGGE